jgi:hypothetical protein
MYADSSLQNIPFQSKYKRSLLRRGLFRLKSYSPMHMRVYQSIKTQPQVEKYL